MIDFFVYLFQSGIATAAFILGGLFLFVALIGTIGSFIKLSGSQRIALLLFGLGFAALGLGSTYYGQLAQKEEKSDHPNATPEATVTALAAPSAAITSAEWIHELSSVPESGTQISQGLLRGQLLYFSGGQFQLGNEFCGGDARQICVLIFQATSSQVVTLTSLIPKENYLGITEVLSPEEVLAEKEPVFWIPPNCINGCDQAIVLFIRDGILVDKKILAAPQ